MAFLREKEILVDNPILSEKVRVKKINLILEKNDIFLEQSKTIYKFFHNQKSQTTFSGIYKRITPISIPLI